MYNNAFLGKPIDVVLYIRHFASRDCSTGLKTKTAQSKPQH